MKKLFLTGILITLVSSFSYALDVETHKVVNEYIAKHTMNGFSLNGFSFDAYLKNQLGIQGGIEEQFNSNSLWPSSQEAWKWLRDGGRYEDKPDHTFPYIRSANHFHNPLQPIDQAGFSGIWNTGLLSGRSAVLWSQNPQGTQSPGGYYSWSDVRNYFYNALTAPDTDGRNKNFADTFRGLGQLMHLVQDMSVPEHVRNEGHYISYMYEDWVLETQNTNQTINPQRRAIFDNALANPIFFNWSLLTQLDSAFSNASVPIANLFDTHQYGGANPNITMSQSIGLAEYTNANFVSPDTRFLTTVFPYPSPITSVTTTMAYVDPTNSGQKVLRPYFQKIADGDTGYLLSGYDYFTYYAQTNGLDAGGLLTIAPMDNNVYSDYAKRLLPRAVGYSAGLLNYFFRGQLGVTPVSGGVKVKNLSSEAMTSYIDSWTGNVIGAIEVYYDTTANERHLLTSYSFLPQSSYQLAPGEETSVISFSEPADNINPGRYIVVFKGKLGNEEGAVAAKVITTGLYFIVLPVDHTTREITGKNYYRLNGGTLEAITESNLPFSVLDDGGYWDQMSSTWTSGDANGLRVPLGTGGPQYIAKYLDGTRVRFIANGSYEKEAYHAFASSPKAPGTSQIIKSFNYVTFVGSPLLGNGSYDENTGWMEYTANGLFAIVPPASQNPRTQRFFSASSTLNFSDTFIEAPSFKFYGFNSATYEAAVPRDPEAPKASILSAYKPDGVDYVNVTIPSVYNTYVRPIPFWTPAAALASSGLDHYRFTSTTEPVFDSHENKCTAENNDCGNISQGATAVLGVYDIPHNYNSKVRVHNNDGGNYYEELYINGALVETSAISTQKLETHYQILAVYKDTAVVRKTTYVSSGETPLAYRYSASAYRIYEKYWNFTSTYAIYLHGVRYDLAGTTAVKSRYLSTPYEETSGTTSPVNYLTYEIAEDITGYHLDRIFISETFDRSNILVAFDEYSYNNGAGLVHDLKYEQSNLNDGKYILYYDMPATKLQNADHEATRTGRKLLLFKSDGTLKAQLQDPIGLGYTIGSIGILN